MFKSLQWMSVQDICLLSENVAEKEKLLLWFVTLFSKYHPYSVPKTFCKLARTTF